MGRVLLCLTLLVGMARAEPAGITRALARSRAARVSEVRYSLRFELKPDAPTSGGTEQITFQLAAGAQAELPLDYRDGELASAEINGHALSTAESNGHLTLPAVWLRGGTNTFKATFASRIAPAGKAITRYSDKDDHNQYLYTLFVPMDADMAFPCFDQPDLKGRFSLTVAAPAAWTVIGNTGAGQPRVQPDGTSSVSFAESKPISTYLFAFAAGPFARVQGKAGEPDVYVRQSQLKKARAEVPELQQMTANGKAYFADFFAQPFPFPKYDLVLIPGFPFGGMEHAGATFLNEDGVLFRSTPTASDRFRRDTLTLHELAHQWFGDLVTMQWFDDLWLKEGFAQYMAYKALAVLDPGSNPWKHFAEDIKPLAYGIDETEGTTPIFQQIPNLLDAKSAYGAIVYQKAPAVLKQLNFRIGDDVFRGGLRIYLRDHGYANAQWADLIGAFEQAGANELKPWAEAWITRRGMPEVNAAFTCAGGKLTSLMLTQRDVLKTGQLWPISDEVLLAYPTGKRMIRADWGTASFRLAEAQGAGCPEYVFANAGDEAYGRFLLDRSSERYLVPMVQTETAPIVATPDLLLRTQLYSALWDNVRNAHSAPKAYAALAVQDLQRDEDESLNRIQGGRIATVLHQYSGAGRSGGLTAEAEGEVRTKMLTASTLGLRIVNYRTFVSLAEQPDAQGDLLRLLDGTLVVPGLELKALDRWNMIGQLIKMDSPAGPKYLAAEQARDHTGEGQKYAYAQQAGAPVAAAKEKYFGEYTASKTIQEDWLSSSLRPFNAWNQTGLTLPFLKPALDALPEIKRDRKIFFLGAWLSAFVDGQNSAEAQAIVHTWLGQPGIDADLRLKVLELSDELDRTVRIRAAYPD